MFIASWAVKVSQGESGCYGESDHKGESVRAVMASQAEWI